MNILVGFAQAPGGFGPPPDMEMNQPPTPTEMAEQESKWMKKKLNLSKEQYEKVNALNLIYATIRSEKMSARMGQAKSQSREMPSQEAMQKIREEDQKLEQEKEAKLKGVFTAEQWETYQKKKKNMPQDMGMAPPAGIMPGNP
ncbi:hypothetical protein QNI16_29050 [Cytophagaceae bacterium YF14B1]|uniref:DUF4890 domain-containing protein n=1 Tax=Xanthocytophaga flava TaxID=3048013 RepID=A0AAE3QSG0_9BACT|nr:hypothetical protein [Xanthocytophaga flavus]MDJ1484582.1 hypothetical protein [Xanthocytophaga flavus]